MLSTVETLAVEIAENYAATAVWDQSRRKLQSTVWERIRAQVSTYTQKEKETSNLPQFAMNSDDYPAGAPSNRRSSSPPRLGFQRQRGAQIEFSRGKLWNIWEKWKQSSFGVRLIVLIRYEIHFSFQISFLSDTNHHWFQNFVSKWTDLIRKIKFVSIFVSIGYETRFRFKVSFLNIFRNEIHNSYLNSFLNRRVFVVIGG